MGAESIPTGRVRRVLPLAAAAGRTAGEVVVSALQQRIRGTGGDRSAVHERAADRYVELLGRSRGVLMKAGQILSFVSFTPPADGQHSAIYRTAMQRLQAQAPPMAPAEAAAVVAAELGAPPEQVFAEFRREPFAAASIGQVHRARTHDGRDVAVKVQYPGVEAAIRADLANVELLTTFLRLGRAIVPDMPRLDTRALADEVTARIGEEIDYRLEAANQTEFADAYRGHPTIRVPEVVGELSTRRVLTMDYVDGMPWSVAIEQDQELRDRWAEVIYRFVWGSLRGLRLANTDPHPGNYLFHPDGTVTFLDFGSVKRYDERQLANIIALERAGTAQDGPAMQRAAVALGFTHDGIAPAAADLLEWMSEMWQPLTAAQPFTYTQEHAASVNRRMYSPFGPHGEVVRRMDMPPEFMFFIRMDAGVTAILGALRATGRWPDILDDLSAGAGAKERAPSGLRSARRRASAEHATREDGV